MKKALPYIIGGILLIAIIIFVVRRRNKSAEEAANGTDGKIFTATGTLSAAGLNLSSGIMATAKCACEDDSRIQHYLKRYHEAKACEANPSCGSSMFGGYTGPPSSTWKTMILNDCSCVKF